MVGNRTLKPLSRLMSTEEVEALNKFMADP
jgi:hypothetical protein